MPISPKTTQFMQEPSAQDKDAAFNQLFEDAARVKLVSQVPSVESAIVTFKILESDPDAGYGVGAFVLDIDGAELYIPAVLTQGQVKPLEVFYNSTDKMFLPLTEEWLAETGRSDVQEMGTAGKRDPTAAEDMDVTNLVRPPYSGRFVYAAVNENSSRLLSTLNKMARVEKKAFVTFLQSNPELFKTAAAVYGVEPLVSALKADGELRTPAEKTAAAEDTFVVVTRDTPAETIQRHFAGNTADAMRKIAMDGYAVIDKRAAVNAVVDADTTLRLHSVQTSGAYDLYRWDGSKQRALVLWEPMSLHKKYTGDPNEKRVDEDTVSPQRTPEPPHLVVITPAGEYTSVRDVQHLLASMPEEVNANVDEFSLSLEKPRLPRGGEEGVWLKWDKDTLRGTEPVRIKSVLTENGGTTAVDDLGRRYVISNDVLTLRKLDDKTLLVPATYTFKPLKLKYDMKDGFAVNPLKLKQYLVNNLKEAGCYNLKVKRGSYGLVTNFDWLEHPQHMTEVKLAAVCNLSMKEAREVAHKAQREGSFDGYILSSLVKEAAPPVPGPPPQTMGAPQMPPPPMPPGSDPAAGGADPAAAQAPMDPAMMGADPAMMGADPAAMAPPPELEALVTAIDEVQSTVNALQEKELQAMQERARSLAIQNAALESVGARVQEVLQGVPAEQSPALQVLDPGAAEEGAAVGSAPEGMAPMGAGAPPPEAGPPSPDAMQAGAGVADPAAFDTAALSQLGRLSAVSSIFGDYVPQLTQSLDHLSRVLLTLQMNRQELADQMSDAELDKLEDNLATVLQDTGNLLLSLNKKVTTMSPSGEM